MFLAFPEVIRFPELREAAGGAQAALAEDGEPQPDGGGHRALQTGEGRQTYRYYIYRLPT